MSTVTAVPLQPVKSSVKIWLWVGIIAALLGAFGLAWVGTRPVVYQHLPADQDAKFLDWHKSQPGVKTTASGLQYMLVKAGKGDVAKDGDGVAVSFIGRFRDGTVFQPQASTQMLVGQGTIPGFGEALKLMNKGSKYRFWIPSALAYGPNPQDPRMPKNAMLIFDIDVTELVTAAEIQQMQQQQAMQQQLQQQMQQQQGGAAGPGGAPEGAPKGGQPQ